MNWFSLYMCTPNYPYPPSPPPPPLLAHLHLRTLLLLLLVLRCILLSLSPSPPPPPPLLKKLFLKKFKILILLKSSKNGNNTWINITIICGYKYISLKCFRPRFDFSCPPATIRHILPCIGVSCVGTTGHVNGTKKSPKNLENT